MYFDGQLHYLDKERQSSMSSYQKPTSHQRAQTTDPASAAASSPQQPQAQAQPQPSSSVSASASMPKSQTVSGAAGDLHSIALKSAISNIGTLPLNI